LSPSMSEAISTGAIVIYVMLLAYMTIGTFIEKHKLAFGHEASFIILIGMAISYSAYATGNKEFVHLLKFDDNTFFFVCLPPIVFASGFNMQRGNFFANIKTIAVLGVLGTFVAFTSFSILTIVLKNWDCMKQYDGSTGEW